jgi:hypothetical protein
MSKNRNSTMGNIRESLIIISQDYDGVSIKNKKIIPQNVCLAT